jgi:hypothetical protein
MSKAPAQCQLDSTCGRTAVARVALAHPDPALRLRPVHACEVHLAQLHSKKGSGDLVLSDLESRHPFEEAGA